MQDTQNASEFNSDIFNLKNFSFSNISDLIVEYGVKVLGAILIIIIGFWLASKISKLIGKSMEKTDMTISMRKFLQSLLSVFFKILVILVAMSTVGFQVTAFVAILGGLAIGIGMALQGSLANLAGGILILFFKPFKVGDFIEAIDKAGTVEEISVLQTILLTPDMRTVILPNGSVFNNPIINYARFGVRRVQVKVGIGYNDDFDAAKEVILKVLKAEPLMLNDRGYIVEIQEFGASSVDLAIFGYTATENFLQAGWNLNRAVKKALDENGFNIPFPQRDLHIVSNQTSKNIEV